MSTETSLRSVRANLIPDHDLNALNGGTLFRICIHLPKYTLALNRAIRFECLLPIPLSLLLSYMNSLEFSCFYVNSYPYVPLSHLFFHKSIYPPNRLYQTNSLFVGPSTLLLSLIRLIDLYSTALLL